jgi:hypothetical protein
MVEHAPIKHPLLVALEQSGLGQSMRESLLLYPLVEVLHILGFVTLFAGIVLFDLRVLGIGRAIVPAQLARISIPLAAGGLGLAIAMGLLLFSTEATHLAANPAFQIKLVLIGLGLLNVWAFRRLPWGDIAGWGQHPPLGARISALASLLFWTGVVICGRLIAYL